MLRVLGIPLLENKKGFLVFGLWFLGFKKCFMLPKDIRYILPNSHFMFSDRYEIHIQDFEDFIRLVMALPPTAPDTKKCRTKIK